MTKKMTVPMTLEEMKERKMVSSLMRVEMSAPVFHPSLEPLGKGAFSAGIDPEEMAKRGIVEAEDEATITRTYRALSAAMIPDRFIDFSHKDGKPLKSATKKFAKRDSGHAVATFKDHRRSVDAWCGSVTKSWWDPAALGLPDGVNTILQYNKEALGKAATQGILDGSLSSVSVTVDFEWSKSHPDMDDWDFFWNLGSEKDGEVVRVLVEKIHSVYEISCVWEGADPTAKTPVAAEAVEPGSYQVAGFAAGDDISGNPAKASWSNVGAGTQKPQHSKEEEAQMNEFLAKLAGILGLTLNEGDEAEKLQSTLCDAVASLKAAAEASGANADTLKAALESEKVISQAFLTDLRDRLARAAALTLGETGVRSLVIIAQRATVEELKALVTEQERFADDKFPIKCEACGSAKVSRKSSVSTPPSAATPPGASTIQERSLASVEAMLEKKK